MASADFAFSRVSRITVGAVGPPGQRTFYMQVREGTTLVTLVIEKEQLRVLGERLQEILSEVKLPPAPGTPNMELEEPLVAAWRVGTLTVAFDPQAQTFEVSLVELVEEGQPAASGKFEASLAQMAALAEHAASVVAAGRPPCPLCGGPIDHDGQACPRLNGHR